jgi:hypothetical protein
MSPEREQNAGTGGGVGGSALLIRVTTVGFQHQCRHPDHHINYRCRMGA